MSDVCIPPSFADSLLPYLTSVLDAGITDPTDIYEFSAQYFEEKARGKLGQMTVSSEKENCSSSESQSEHQTNPISDFSYDSDVELLPNSSTEAANEGKLIYQENGGISNTEKNSILPQNGTNYQSNPESSENVHVATNVLDKDPEMLNQVMEFSQLLPEYIIVMMELLEALREKNLIDGREKPPETRDARDGVSKRVKEKIVPAAATFQNQEYPIHISRGQRDDQNYHLVHDGEDPKTVQGVNIPEITPVLLMATEEENGNTTDSGSKCFRMKPLSAIPDIQSFRAREETAHEMFFGTISEKLGGKSCAKQEEQSIVDFNRGQAEHLFQMIGKDKLFNIDKLHQDLVFEEKALGNDGNSEKPLDLISSFVVNVDASPKIMPTNLETESRDVFKSSPNKFLGEIKKEGIELLVSIDLNDLKEDNLPAKGEVPSKILVLNENNKALAEHVFSSESLENLFKSLTDHILTSTPSETKLHLRGLKPLEILPEEISPVQFEQISSKYPTPETKVYLRGHKPFEILPESIIPLEFKQDLSNLPSPETKGYLKCNKPLEILPEAIRRLQFEEGSSESSPPDIKVCLRGHKPLEISLEAIFPLRFEQDSSKSFEAKLHSRDSKPFEKPSQSGRGMYNTLIPNIPGNYDEGLHLTRHISSDERHEHLATEILKRRLQKLSAMQNAQMVEESSRGNGFGLQTVFTDNVKLSVNGRSWLRTYFAIRYMRTIKEDDWHTLHSQEQNDVNMGTPIWKVHHQHTNFSFPINCVEWYSIFKSFRIWYFTRRLRVLMKEIDTK